MLSPDLYFVALITLLTLLMYYGQSIGVGLARRKHGIKPPHTTGNLDFERVFRVHYNTLEQLPLFLIPLWLFALTVSPYYAGWLGLVWLIGRAGYAYGYYMASDKRHSYGSVLSYISGAILIFGSLFAIVAGLMV
jgi:glutathione S-transferase